jgi:hypothetical protein
LLFFFELVLIGDYHISCFLVSDDGEATDTSSIPLDDGMPVDFDAIEVVQLLIEHHNAVFTDANETVWK